MSQLPHPKAGGNQVRHGTAATAVFMTVGAMIFGMLPMAIGMGESGSQDG
jgi:hypothetical protein